MNKRQSGYSKYTNIDRHNNEMHSNLDKWQRKPVLEKIYQDFHRQIANHLPKTGSGTIVELGSGIPDIRLVVPDCIRTDIFPKTWIDQVENCYQLSFEDQSVSALILMDVFHHLRYPGTALAEFKRVLVPGGRLIILEPCVSWLGRLVYGLLHHEPLGMGKEISWLAPPSWSPEQLDYYAAQGNASRIFLPKRASFYCHGFQLHNIDRLTALPYILSGGYSKPQLFPDCALDLLQSTSQLLDHWPRIFATRLLVVLEKTQPFDTGKKACR